MAASQEGLLRVSSSPGQLQMTCTGEFVALPLTKTIVGVWWLGDISRKPLQLSAHSGIVSTTCFGRKDRPLLLCTASEDFIYIWNIDKLLLIDNITSDHSSGIAVGKDLGHVQHLSFSMSDRLITACIEKEIWVINIQTSKLDTLLEGHTSIVTCAEFSPKNESIVVSISEDRTFKVWNIEQSCLVYQSAILSAHPFLSLALDSVQEQMVIGSADGKVHLYDLAYNGRYRCLYELDVNKLMQKHWRQKETVRETPENGPSIINSQRSWQSKSTPDDENEAVLEPGMAVLAVSFITNPHQQSAAHRDAGTHRILFGSHSGSAINSELDDVQYHISTPGSFAFAERPDGNIACLIGSLFQNTVNVVNIKKPNTNTGTENPHEDLSQRLSQSVDISSHGDQEEGTSPIRGAEMATNTAVTVLSSAPLCSNSPLKAELVPKTATKQRQKQKPSTKGMKTEVFDQPLTFHSKVKSSGYSSSAARSKMFSPSTSASKPKKASAFPLKKAASTSLCSGASLKEYPMDSEAPTDLQHKLSHTEKPAPINCIVFSDDGKHIACGLANKSVHMMRPPPSSKETVFTGHDGSVTSVSFSHDSRWLMTSSSDKTVKLWSSAHSDPGMTFSSVNHNFASELTNSTNVKDNPPFSKEITQAKFYYIDKFVLLASGNGLHMYKYHIGTGQKDDVKRYQTNNKYKLVKIFQQERAQQITCFSAINGFHSYIVLCCGSNKSIQVFDMNAARTVRVVMDAHTRPVHTICQNEGSMFVSHPPNAYDLFLTAAVTDGIKLWDLRTNRCVRRYDGHVNRSQPIGVAISPCARFIATGSEDRSAYLYDIRGNTFCHRLTGHTDVVSEVAFHPAQPQVLRPGALFSKICDRHFFLLRLPWTDGYGFTPDHGNRFEVSVAMFMGNERRMITERVHGVKRKLTEVDGDDEVHGRSLQRQTVFNISICKLQKRFTRPEPILFKTVLISNTLRLIEEDIREERRSLETNDLNGPSDEKTFARVVNMHEPTNRPGLNIGTRSRDACETSKSSLTFEQELNILGDKMVKELELDRENSKLLEEKSELLTQNPLTRSAADSNNNTPGFEERERAVTSNSEEIIREFTCGSLLGLELTEELEFKDVDVSLYDFDVPNGSFPIDFDEFCSVWNLGSTSVAARSLPSRCSDSVKLERANEHNFDDLDQVMQILVGS
ncbi:WD repeat-containing protein 27 [Stylophora pistillata]|uniref:WD repeat-containing protein 27 n=1 Tax=Stylophora pistillata TaxID=50429 RepID=A0A2B4SV71_STYPI|nr:WD repeat-containing protein 27 [Stylophora pistillata]